MPIALAVRPGPLSSAHAFLENDCAACHTPRKGVEADSCISCHANNQALLAMQPTAFHANISSCTPCHAEHQGGSRPTQMNHVALARIGLRELEAGGQGNPSQPLPPQLVKWLRERGRIGPTAQNHPKITAEEALLDCASCHATQGQGQTMHAKLMGPECASCHATTQWTIPEFQHPSPNSTDCSQCHQAPPSHYMMHFNMMSQSIAKQPRATVNQCYSCHQTTAWNDIKGVGWRKVH